MATSPSPDLCFTTPACVVWECDDEMQSLIEPDPRTRSVLFETRFDSQTTSASFTIRCPIRLKGIDSYSYILSSISPRAITSFAFKAYPNSPEQVRKKLNCTTVRLRFKLDQPPQIIASAAATEPVQPRKRLSAEVLHSLRSLATASSLDIYVSDRELPHTKLNAIREAVAQSLLRPFTPNLSDTLVSLYGGRGGKLVDLSLRVNAPASQDDEPPPYSELKPVTLPAPEVLPPADQFIKASERKRPRHDDSSSCDENDCRLHLTWTVVVKMREEMNKLAKRVEHLEKENKELKEELEVMREGCEKATDSANADEVAILEVRDELNELTDRVDYLTKNGLDSEVEESIVKKVTNRAVTNVLAKNYKLSLEDD